MFSQHGIGILVTGSEVLDGRVLDTNSHFLASELSARGISVRCIHLCDDDLQEIQSGLEFLSRSCSFIVVSGGLGPTTDDLTREAVAAFCGTHLVESSEALGHLTEFYARRGRELDSSNFKQTLIPHGASIVPNPVGTAPGFLIARGAKTKIVALPGVPAEFRRMLEESVLNLIREDFREAVPLIIRGFRVLGLPESIVGQKTRAICKQHSDVVVSYRASFPEVHVLLKSARMAAEELEALVSHTIEELGSEYVFTRDPTQSFESAVLAALSTAGKTVCCAESCTGGLVARMFTEPAGASGCFLGGVSAYSNLVKARVLKVAPEIIAQHGAVSPETAAEMARGARTLTGASFAVSVTGIAGPDGGTPEKPVGVFFLGLDDGEQEVRTRRYHWHGTRGNVRIYAAYAALDAVRRLALGLPTPPAFVSAQPANCVTPSGDSKGSNFADPEGPPLNLKKRG
jgi:nicotinamide-nucleotide amidase